MQFLRSGKSQQYNIAILKQQGRDPILGRWELDSGDTLQQFKSKYPKIDERKERALLDYLETISEHLSLSFSDGYCYLEGRAFPERALGVRVAKNNTNDSTNDFLPDIPPTNLTAYSRLINHGSWERNPAGTYLTQFNLMNATSQVSIQLYPSRIMLTLESFRSEKYVFKRQKL